MEQLICQLLLGPVLLLYLVPTIIACQRAHPQAQVIFYLNLLLGWTLLGWIACLVWALVNPAREQGALLGSAAQHID